MSNVVKTGALASTAPLVVAVERMEAPLTVTLTSAAAGRLIELSTNGGLSGGWYSPAVDASTASMINVALESPVTHVRFTGAANDTWRVESAAEAPVLVQRTVSITLGDASGPAVNLTGLKVTFREPDMFGLARYESVSETTNEGGVLSFAFGSTLAAGAFGHLTVLGPAGVHYNQLVAVA